GVGRALMRWAIDRARDKHASHMMIEADPGAAPFYERMGARIVGQVASEAIVGRTLPLLRLDLPGLAPAA
ncbi:MAG: GNAT family N-acetyltransferase, partial [Pseudomonadota bacterium]